MYTLLLFIISLFFLIYRIASTKNVQAKRSPPQASGGWPIIGHLHLLCGSQLPHVTLGYMAEKYGPIFTIKRGIHKTLVVSNHKIAQECLGTNDEIFSNRPKSIAVEVMGYNYAMFGFGPYGTYWRQMRQKAMHELLTTNQLKKFSPLREAEVRESIKELNHLWLNNKGENGMVKVEMKQWFGRLTLNMVVQMLVKKRYSCNDEDGGGEGRRSLKAFRTFIELVGTVVVGDSIPYLRWLDLGGYEKAMKKNAKEIDIIFQGWLEEHKGKIQEKGGGEDEDFMGILLSSLNNESSKTIDLGGHHPETAIKAVCLSILTGAVDTTMVALTWALCLLLNNRRELKKAQNELDIHIGRTRQVQDSDMKNLNYLQAIIKESLRLYPAGQLLPTRESREDCVVSGYTIPKGTQLVLNLSKIHRDPNVWSDPDEFQPERFLTKHKDVDVKGKHFELLPFGSGRRMCPGYSLGLQIIQLTLANLIHGFEFETPGNEAIDMTASIGLSNFKAGPLEVLIRPRLSSSA